MKTKHTQIRYVECLNAEDMHNESKKWLSELRFIKDEHQFFEDLITSYTLQLIEPEKFSHNKEIIDALNRSQKRNNTLIRTIVTHENGLQIMVDGEDQLKEEDEYKKEHRALILVTNDFFKNYKLLKKQLFDIVRKIKKEEKYRRLLDERL